MNFQNTNAQEVNSIFYYSPTTFGFYTKSIHGTNMPVDVIELSQERHKELLELQSQGKLITVGQDGDLTTVNRPLPTTEQTTATFIVLIQKKLDTFAKTKGYDSILSACTYATSTVPKFAAEGQAAVNIRDTTWACCYDILEAVQAGTRPMPTFTDIEAELPAMTWPVTSV